MEDNRHDAEPPSLHTCEGIDLRRWRFRCEGLARICEATAWSVEPDLVYQRMTDVVAEVLHCSQTHLHLITVDGDQFIKLAYHTSEQQQAFHESVLLSTTGRTQWMMRTHKPIVMDYEHPNCEDEIPPEAYESGLKSAVSIPLLAGDELVGMCSIVYETAVEWSEDGLAFLLQIGRVLGVAIQRIQITKKASELQILDERKRLSSEIHDNISQLVGSLSLSVAAVLASYEADDDDAVRADLERLETMSGKVMRILRDEMLSLRIPLEHTDGFITGIEDCLAHFESSWGIPVDFHRRTLSKSLVVSLQTSLQLTRILNECLSNTLKHADASHIVVTVEESNRCLTMTMEDDGHGFDPNTVPPERLGLKIMHERAAVVGGKLTIISDASGTTVCIDIPKNRLDGMRG
ncbi:GAF domain-containing sensor histidine kinase [Gordonibacter sp. 28C]|uniref:GAF domain-containing sensor histidine kinase n=1 Tax=Gordonibacter sp. 28C TaxID=2078569 RepID=UPI001314BD7E|nr:GAF domain-containing sensor histidine kinase [Gordonibacter sp. 28C]